MCRLVRQVRRVLCSCELLRESIDTIFVYHKLEKMLHKGLLRTSGVTQIQKMHLKQGSLWLFFKSNFPILFHLGVIGVDANRLII
jgi:hypothetical protein